MKLVDVKYDISTEIGWFVCERAMVEHWKCNLAYNHLQFQSNFIAINVFLLYIGHSVYTCSGTGTLYQMINRIITNWVIPIDSIINTWNPKQNNPFFENYVKTWFGKRRIFSISFRLNENRTRTKAKYNNSKTLNIFKIENELTELW